MSSWKVTFVGFGVLLLTALIGMSEPYSLLAGEPQIEKLRAEWQDELLLPATLYGTATPRIVSVEDQQGQRFLHLQLDLMPDEGNRLGRLTIIERPTEAKALPTLNDQPLDQVLAEIEQPLNPVPGRYANNKVTKAESIEAGDHTAYWYTTNSRSDGQFFEQGIEFLQDGYHVQMTLSLPEYVFTKEKFIDIAQSFREL